MSGSYDAHRQELEAARRQMIGADARKRGAARRKVANLIRHMRTHKESGYMGAPPKGGEQSAG